MENRISSILILKQKPGSLKLAEQFLRNRSWELYIVNNLKSLIVNLAQRQPEYVIIPVDFPHKKINILPSVLAQAFSIKIIIYAEHTTSVSTAKLQEFKSDYKLYPPVSGPAIERMIFKIQRDEVLRQEEVVKQNSVTQEKASTEYEIRIKEEQAHAREALRVILGEDEARHGLSHSSKANDPHTTISSGSEGGSAVSIQNMGYGVLGNNYIPGQYETTDPITGSGIGTQDSPAHGESEGSIPFYGNRNLNFEGLKHNKGKEQNQLEESNVTAASQSAQVIKSDQRPNLETGLTRDNDFSGFKNTGIQTLSSQPAYKFRSKEKVVNETIIVRGTEKALEESRFVRGGVQRISEVKSAKNAACIIIESPKFSGYLVAVMGSDRAIDDAYLVF